MIDFQLVVTLKGIVTFTAGAVLALMAWYGVQKVRVTRAAGQRLAAWETADAYIRGLEHGARRRGIDLD